MKDVIDDLKKALKAQRSNNADKDNKLDELKNKLLEVEADLKNKADLKDNMAVKIDDLKQRLDDAEKHLNDEKGVNDELKEEIEELKKGEKGIVKTITGFLEGKSDSVIKWT